MTLPPSLALSRADEGYDKATARGSARRSRSGLTRSLPLPVPFRIGGVMITTANCPSCGGPITFKVGSSITVICEFCGSAVARTDRDVRNLGKVADLIDTQSPLR